VIITLRRTDQVVARAAASVHIAAPGAEGSAWHSAINR